MTPAVTVNVADNNHTVYINDSLISPINPIILRLIWVCQFQPGFFLHLIWNRAFVDEWQKFLRAERPTWHPSKYNSIGKTARKKWRKIQNSWLLTHVHAAVSSPPLMHTATTTY